MASASKPIRARNSVVRHAGGLLAKGGPMVRCGGGKRAAAKRELRRDLDRGAF